MSEYIYIAPSSVLILKRILNALRLDIQRSDISLLGDGTGTSTKAYMLNNMFLPIMIVVLWLLLVLLIICFKRNWCDLRGRCCILGGKKKNHNNHGATEENSAADDVVTIVTLDGFLVRGNIEDKVRYLTLQNQLKLTRNICCFMAILVFCVSLTTLVLVGNLHHSHSSIMKETETVVKYFTNAGFLMEDIIRDREVLVMANDELIDSIDTSSQEECFDNGITDTVENLSTSLLALNQNLDNSTLQIEWQLWTDAEFIANDIYDKLRWISPLFTTSVCSIALTTAASISLFAGTMIARKNILKPWHRFLFHFVTFPVGILSSIILWASLAFLIFISVPLVDFCTGMTGGDGVGDGDPIESVLSILRARGFGDSSIFYTTAEKYMEDDCSEGSMVEAMSDTLKLFVANLEILQASDRSDTCTSYTSLLTDMNEFNGAYDNLKSDIHKSNSNLNCNSFHEWYTGVAYDETCTRAPDSLSYSILFTLILAVLSTLLLSLSIAWKTDTQVFLEVSGVGDLDDDATVADDDEERNKKRDDSLFQFKFNSVRFSRRKEMNVSTPESLFDDPINIQQDIMLTKDESEKKAEFWKKLLKNNDKQRKKEAKDDLLQQMANKPPTRKGYATWEPDDPIENGEVEVEARLYSRGDQAGRMIAPAHKAYWQDPFGNYQSYELFGQYDSHSLLAGGMGYAEQENRGNQMVSGVSNTLSPISAQAPEYQKGVVMIKARRQPSQAVRRQPSKAATPITYYDDEVANFISREPLEGEEAYYDEVLDEALQMADGQYVQQVVQHSPSEYDVYYVEQGQLQSQRVNMSDPLLPITPAHGQNVYNQESLKGLNALKNKGQSLQGQSEWDKAAAKAITSRENQFPASLTATNAFPRTIVRDPSSGKFMVQESRSTTSGQQFVSNQQLQNILQQNTLPPISPKQSSKKEKRSLSRNKSRSSSRKKSARSRSRSRSRKNQRVVSDASLESEYYEDDSEYSSEYESSAYSGSEGSSFSDDETSYEERRRRIRSRNRNKNSRGGRRSRSRNDRRREQRSRGDRRRR